MTTILNPARNVILNRRHYDDIEVDASSCVNQLFGTAIHSLIEKFDKTGMAEMYLKEEICRDNNGVPYYLTGKCDLYDSVNKELVDWKSANVWKIKFNDFEDPLKVIHNNVEGLVEYKSLLFIPTHAPAHRANPFKAHCR